MLLRSTANAGVDAPPNSHTYKPIVESRSPPLMRYLGYGASADTCHDVL